MSAIKHYLHTKMTETTDNIIDRDALKTTYDDYSVDELIAEVEEYYPHLLEE